MLNCLSICVWLAAAASTQATVPELEKELWSHYRARKWVSARRVGEELLAKDGQSIVGHLAVGNVYWEADANFSQALHHLTRAEELYEARYTFDMDKRWKLHAEIVLALTWLASEMDRQEEQLAWIDHFNRFFKPPIHATKAWPLMELGRYGEASAIIAEGLKSDRPAERLRAHNSNCAIHARLGQREAAYEACMASLAYSRTMADPDLTVVARNAAESAVAVLDFDAAERLIDEAAAGSASSSTNPPMYKTALLLAQGRGAQALVEAQRALRWHLRQTPAMRGLSRAELDHTLALVFLLAGEDRRGLAAIDRAIRFPDRLGGTSDDPLQRQGGDALLRLALRELSRQRAAERASAEGLWGRVRHWLATHIPDTGGWVDEGQVVQACANQVSLLRTLRYHSDRGLNSAHFLKPDLVPILGAGVVEVALESARIEETFDPVRPLFGVFDAEIAWQRGDEEATLAFARRTFFALPEAQAISRAQLAVLAAQAAWDLEQRATALEFFTRALRLDPGSLRRRGVRLPAMIAYQSQSPLLATIAETLARSPRIEEEPGAFTIAVTGSDARVELCLRSPAGNRIHCTTVRRPAQDSGAPVSEDVFVRLVADQFHRRMFAMRMGDSSLDLSSLDGSTIKNQAASEEMEALLDGI